MRREEPVFLIAPFFYCKNSEQVIIVKMLHNVLNPAMQDITESVDRVDLHVFVVA